MTAPLDPKPAATGALTLVILVITCKPGSVALGSPGELSSTR